MANNSPPMLKMFKESICQLDDLPDEVLLKILSYLDIKGLLRCSHVCRRIRSISHDESLWQKINLCEKIVPTEFLEFVLNNGCKYLSLKGATLTGNLILMIKNSQLKYLDLSECNIEGQILLSLLASCHSLTKLSLLNLKYKNIEMEKRHSKSQFSFELYRMQNDETDMWQKNLYDTMFKCISFQNGGSLQVLNLEWIVHTSHYVESMKHIFNSIQSF